MQSNNIMYFNYRIYCTVKEHFFTVHLIQSGQLNIRWTGNVARMDEGRSDIKILTRKPTGKRT